MWWRQAAAFFFIGKRTLTRVASFEVIGQEISTSFASGINALWVAVLVFGLAYAASMYTAWVSRSLAAITLPAGGALTPPPSTALALPYPLPELHLVPAQLGQFAFLGAPLVTLPLILIVKWSEGAALLLARLSALALIAAQRHLYAASPLAARPECLRASSLPGAMDVAELRRMADQGNAEAQHTLGNWHSNGHIVPQDYAEAADLLRRAADQGHLDARCELGMAYRDGMGVPQDDREAARLFRRSANKGHAGAQCALGRCYEYDKGMPQDVDEAARLYRRAAQQGNPLGQYNLGVSYRDGKGVPQDDREAARLFGLAAEQGIAEAQFSFAGCCENGRGVPQNIGEAARYYRLAVEQGHAIAQHNYGTFCILGRGVPQDDNEAARLFRLAAEQGLADTKANLGRLSELGRGIGEATRFYRLAAELLFWAAAAGWALLAAPGEAARFLAQAAQQTGDEESHLEALAMLSKYAHDPDVVKACCEAADGGADEHGAAPGAE
ncbi:hypothetical protein T492DRAFT_898106 [Pavlovales sp. CCMP2436]|nr:hypothetical protein T492DRAFT_898106 [Pavlovales sp. CCMP2436]